MHLARRAYVLVLLTAVLAIVGIWSAEPDWARLWRIPAGLLLLGLAVEARYLRRPRLTAHLAAAPRALLGVPHPVGFEFVSRRAAAADARVRARDPAGLRGADRARGACALPAGAAVRDALPLLPVRLGPQPWPPLPARVLGPLALAWWSTALQPPEQLVVAPDALRAALRLRGLCGRRAAAARRRRRRRAASAARLRARRPAHAHRLEGDRARRHADHARVQRGPASRHPGRDRRRAAVAACAPAASTASACTPISRRAWRSSSRTTTTASGSWSMPTVRWPAARRRAALRP